MAVLRTREERDAICRADVGNEFSTLRLRFASRKALDGAGSGASSDGDAPLAGGAGWRRAACFLGSRSLGIHTLSVGLRRGWVRDSGREAKRGSRCKAASAHISPGETHHESLHVKYVGPKSSGS